MSPDVLPASVLPVAGRPLSIAIVRQRYNPFGGAERFVERALGALAAQGAQVSLITRDWAGAPQAGFRQITCNPPYSRLFGGRAARDRSFAQGVQAIWARERFDITQSHERIPGCMIFRAGDGVHAAWLERRARLLNPMQRLAQACDPYHRYILASERALFAHPALRAVICNSPMVADEIEAFYGVDRKRLPVIYNGVDTERFSPALRETFRAEMRAALAIPAEAAVLLFVGSGFERKGVPQLLRAFATLPDRSAFLVVVGADRRLKAMQQRAAALGIAERVRFAGPVQDVRPYYGMADAFALPTLYDPGPNAALEAMACGLPLLTTPGCGAKAWVRPRENGVLVDALDIDALSVALSQVLALGQTATARQAARQAVEGLTLEAMVAELQTLYRTLVA